MMPLLIALSSLDGAHEKFQEETGAKNVFTSTQGIRPETLAEV